MSLGAYLKSNFGEFLLVWLSSWCVANVGFDAFFLTSATSRTPVSLGVCAVLAAALFVAAHDRKRLAAGVVGDLVLAALVVGACLALSTGQTPYEDAEGNFLYLGVVIVAAVTACFLLTRTLAGSFVWFIASTFVCSLVQAFYQADNIAFSIASCLIALALIVYRNFRLGLLRSDAAKKASGATNLLASVLPIAASVGAALAVWALVIAPMNPGVVKITLITDYRQLPIIEVKGIANRQPNLNYDLTSNSLVGGERYTTDDLKKGPSDTVLNAKSVLDSIASGGQANTGQGNDSGTQGGLDRDSTQQQYNATSYTASFPVAWIVLIVIAAVALLVAGTVLFRRWRRKHRLKRMLSQQPMQQMQSLYLFLVKRLARLGFKVPQGRTLMEFATESATRMAALDAETRVPFSKLTEVYVACTCDERPPSEEELVPFVSYYLGFWSAARRYLGNIKYFFKSFRL